MSVFKIIGMSLIAMAATSHAEEFIVRHRQPVQKLELIVSNPVGAVSGCPLDASVIVSWRTPLSKTEERIFTGSGVCVLSEGGTSSILTCAHNLRGRTDQQINVRHDGKDYIGTLANVDEANDLAVVTVSVGIPTVDLSPLKPSVGETVTSVGIKDQSASTLAEQSHRIASVSQASDPVVFETDGVQMVGRSGGGLFYNGQLCGIIKGKRESAGHSLYVSIEPIREILSKHVNKCESCSVEQYGAGGPVDVEFIKSPGWCPPCNQTERRFVGNQEWAEGQSVSIANGRLNVTKRIGVGPWYDDAFRSRNEEAGYPFYRFKVDGEWKTYYGATSPEQLLAIVESQTPHEVTAFDSGAKLSGKPIVETFLNGLQSYFGPDATFSLKIHREGGKDAILMGHPFTREDLVGTSGTVAIEVTSTKKLPVKRFSFKYRFVDGKPYIDPDEIAVDLSDDGTVGASQAVGSPILLAWTIISTIDTIWRIFHPSVSLYLGPDIELFGKLENDGLTVDVRSNISVKLGWSFWMGLLKFEYGRAVTGAILHPDNLAIQFHKSRLYRDVNIPVQ